MKTALVSVLAAAIAGGALAAEPAAAVKSGYVFVNGLKMYYEIQGQKGAQGLPLVLLHGGYMNLYAWGPTLPALAESRQVIAFELEGHGRTADLDRPLSVEQMAEDVAAGLGQLGVKQADIFGYSLGGEVAIRAAVKHPDLVRKLVLVSTVFDNSGFYPSITAMWPSTTPQALAGTPMEQGYLQLAPDPKHWPVFVEKMTRALVGFKGWPESDIRSIKAPALVVFGDNDVVLPEYEVRMFRLLGGDKANGGMMGSPASQMAVLPATTHFTIFMRADALLPVVTPFLDARMPAGK